jgi:hypothetical protein
MKIKSLLAAACMGTLLASAAQAAPHKLLVISVDGLDWRYLRDRDALGLKIPNIRKIIARSQIADGVTGVWPTITWPSHTTMLTGVRPDQHGIQGNASGAPDRRSATGRPPRSRSPPSPNVWRARAAPSAQVNWPVTVDCQDQLEPAGGLCQPPWRFFRHGHGRQVRHPRPDRRDRPAPIPPSRSNGWMTAPRRWPPSIF